MIHLYPAVCLGIYPDEQKLHKCVNMSPKMYFMMFMIVKHWKQPKYPSVEDGSNKLYATVIKNFLGLCLLLWKFVPEIVLNF